MAPSARLLEDDSNLLKMWDVEQSDEPDAGDLSLHLLSVSDNSAVAMFFSSEKTEVALWVELHSANNCDIPLPRAHGRWLYEWKMYLQSPDSQHALQERELWASRVFEELQQDELHKVTAIWRREETCADNVPLHCFLSVQWI
ncbi:hypothetical protein G5714_017450 [Onychostoma macrolepis]|uniref:Uncharacterized protein n=1 Tax=Onychostoma macrolepis TaxID=369639 RepID=A0A7J6C170_9TELE|nr:hypothetical protein G5714_017450 [Onychostoma macrolepis]